MNLTIIEPLREEDQGGDLVAFVNPQTSDIVECNDNLVEATGYPKASLIGRDVLALYPKACQSDALSVFQNFLQNGKVVEADLRLKKRGRGTIPVTLRLSGSYTNQGGLECTRFSFHNISKRKKVEESLKEKKDFLEKRLDEQKQELQHTKQKIRKEVRKREAAEAKAEDALHVVRRQHRTLRRLAGRLITVQEAERRRLARDLHDDICQKLAMVAFQADTLTQRLHSSPKIDAEELRSLYQQISDVNSDVRKLSHHLHPSVLEHLGLVQALEAYIDEFTRQQHLKVTFSHKNIPKVLPANMALCLYRITQECIGNIAKHAQANHAWVTLRGFAKSIRLTVRDNGIGFSQQKLKAFQQGLGFISMVERTHLVKGKLRVESKWKEGTQIVVTIPWSLKP